MSYIVSARKYRPSTFEEVVGQEHVTATLVNALLTDKLAHAFLFCGPRGVGKTTCARLLAKLINMPDPKKAAKDGSYADADIDVSLNIIELDAASNNSVEHIRALTDQVRFQPQSGKYKVFIIDEVHMLSQAAFNAFLKTLEEPPPYAVFILATTEKHKILPTILSRCQLYDFRRIQVPEIIGQLKKIAASEGIEYEEDALYTLAERADGAMRDALSIFDRVANASDNHITYKSVVRNLNLLDFDYYFKMTNAFLIQDSSEVLSIFDKVLVNGFDGDQFMNGLATHLRNLLYCKQDQTLSIFQVSQQLKELYSRQAGALDYGDLMTFLHLTNQCDIHYQRAKDKRLHCEIALLKMCFASNRHTIPVGTGSSEEKKTAPKIDSGRSAPPVTGEEMARSEVPEALVPNHRQSSKKEYAPEKEAPAEQEVIDLIEADPAEEKEEKEEKENEDMSGIRQNLINTPSFPSIQDLLVEVNEELKTTNGSRRELDLEEVKDIWTRYAKNSASPTTQAIFDQAILEIENQELKIFVSTNIAKEEIQQEPDLYAELRDYFKQPDLVVDVQVDRQRFPDSEESRPKKLYTTKEKYDHLVKKNPLFADMVSKLKLKPDQDG